ncbi:hypothetical protein CSOJ01_15294 [Colletotrichum sojae]|uniref:Uncharacterized protein n=1 Tax=Colletotrichum sojae TaxID=2175907 RepID=A0A8H6MJ36_9PEZI|nr:hypothetical protein CSOJ01_15294 [Colletotrichum sojae]
MTQLLPHVAHSPPYRYLDPVPYLIDSAPTFSTHLQRLPNPVQRPRPPSANAPKYLDRRRTSASKVSKSGKKKGLVTVATVETVGYPLAASEVRYDAIIERQEASQTSRLAGSPTCQAL